MILVKTPDGREIEHVGTCWSVGTCGELFVGPVNKRQMVYAPGQWLTASTVPGFDQCTHNSASNTTQQEKP